MARTPFHGSGADVAGLAAALSEEVDAEVRFDAGSRGAYSTDGPAYQSLLVLGYDDICTAADDVPRPLEHCAPGQLEALDGRMAQLMREERAYLESLDALPEDDSWLMLQFFGDSRDAVDEQAHALLGAIGRSERDRTVTFSDDPKREQRMPKAREAGLGVTARPPHDRETWEGWEDSAVPPERLGDYLRDLRKLFGEFDYDRPSLYGHFGQGCVHTRIPFELRTAEGVAGFRRFVGRAADLVSSSSGGSGAAPRNPTRPIRAPCCCGPTPSAPTSTPRSPSRPCAFWRPPGSALPCPPGRCAAA
ncbi:FAD-binding oxidoreductase [Streptomyces sp. NPDC050416]|uniref:FAD-binding oxidoreductase n=1 Tax=Streptomyces sp. NPDC050416 TaxID=3365611 RepID=UPI00379504A1